MAYSNCLVFAWHMWRYGRGDHFIVRKSHWGWFPHFKVLFELRDGTVVTKEYRPISPRKHAFPPIFFRGRVVTTVYSKKKECECAFVPPICGECRVV